MADVYVDGVAQFTGAGEGDLTLGDASGAARTLASAFALAGHVSGDRVPYSLTQGSEIEWGWTVVTESGGQWTAERLAPESELLSGGSRMEAAGGGATVFRVATFEQLMQRIDNRADNGGDLAVLSHPNLFTADQSLDLASADSVDDDLLEWLLIGRNDADVAKAYGGLTARILNPTANAEEGMAIIEAMVAGALEKLFFVAGDGLAAAGLARRGAGTGHFTGIFVNNQPVGAGAWELVETLTPSSDAFVDFTTGFSASYYLNRFVFDLDVAPDIRFRRSGQGSFDATIGDYPFSIIGGSSSTGNGQIDDRAPVGDIEIINGAGAVQSIWRVNATSRAASPTAFSVMGYHDYAAAIDAVRFLPGFGGAFSGTIKHYRAIA